MIYAIIGKETNEERYKGMICVKIYQKEGEESIFATAPILVEELEVDDEDRGTILDLMSVYDPEKYMIIVSYQKMTDKGTQWMQLSSLFELLRLRSGNQLVDPFMGKA